MSEINWLRAVDMIGAHKRIIEFSGGSDDIRDEGLLESALARPRNLHAYEQDVSMPRLAAAYGYGIASNHPFVDGNKRVAFVAIELFLDLHGLRLNASEEDKYVAMIKLAAGDLTEDELTDWLTAHCE